MTREAALTIKKIFDSQDVLIKVTNCEKKGIIDSIEIENGVIRYHMVSYIHAARYNLEELDANQVIIYTRM